MHFLALPTWRGLLLLFLAAAALAVVYVNSGFITAFTAALLSAVVLSSFLMAQLSFAGLVFKRTFLQDGSCNTPLYLEISLQNRLPLYRQSCFMVEDYPFVLSGQTSFVIPALAPREKFCAVSPVTPEKRGVYELKKVYLCSGDPLGLFRRKKRFLLPAQVEIHPRLLVPESLAAVNQRGGLPDAEGRNLGRAGKGKEFFGVRPYRIGDEVRHIHWKSTAAKGKLMVKEFEASAVDQVTILLDTEHAGISTAAGDNNFEFLVSCAGSIAKYLSEKYCYLRFAAADPEGGLWLFSGDAATVSKQIRQALLHIEGAKLDFSTVLKSISESIPPRSSVYLLSMSVQDIPDYIAILEEQECTCFWLYAPQENFPPGEPDKPRVINRKKVRESLAGLACMPDVADFTTGAEILEGRSLYEKI